MEEKSLNQIIPQLLHKSSKYTNAVKKRIKIRSIFSEFDQKANDHFRNFIDESNKRYKGIKSGNHLDTLIYNSKEKYNSLADKILTDNFYIQLNLDQEKEKMRTKTNKQVVKEVTDLMKKVKEYTNVLPKTEQIDYNKDIAQTPRTNSKTGQLHLTRTTLKSPRKFDENEKVLNDIITEDHNTFQNNMKDYQSYLNELKENINLKDQIEKPYNAYHLLENLKMLSYKKEEKVKEEKVLEKRKTINMKKLLKFSKLGKNIITLHENDKEEEQTEFQSPGIINNNNYKDIISLVKNEANNGLYLDEVFDEKREKLNNKFKSYQLPELKEYDTIINNKLNRDKLKRRRIIKRKTINMSEALLEPEERLRRNIIQKRNNLKICSDLFVTCKNIDDF